MAAVGKLGSVVVATDFSEGARSALERAALLPLRIGASIEVLHVVTEERKTTSSVTPRLEDARRSVARALTAAGSGERAVFISTQYGQPFAEIARSAHHGRAELVVLGRTATRSWRDRISGTTVERVVRNGDVSVLVVAEPAEAPYRRPLVAVDLSESSRLALELASRLGQDAAIDVLCLVTSGFDLAESGFIPDLGRLRANIELNARAELSAMLGRVEGAPAKWNIVVRTGSAHNVILEEARRRQSDLIVLGTRERTGLSHVLSGSGAESVLRDAVCDVLVARLPRADFKLS